MRNFSKPAQRVRQPGFLSAFCPMKPAISMAPHPVPLPGWRRGEGTWLLALSRSKRSPGLARTTPSPREAKRSGERVGVRGDPLDFSKPLAHRQKQEAVGHTPSFLGKDETSAWGEGEGEGRRLKVAVSPSPVALCAPASPPRGEKSVPLAPRPRGERIRVRGLRSPRPLPPRLRRALARRGEAGISRTHAQVSDLARHSNRSVIRVTT
jgi:hypothetical protein